MLHVKCVVIGDSNSQKTSLLEAFNNKDECDVTVYDNYEKRMTIQDKDVNLQMWDTPGQENYKKLRPITYAQTDVLILCFSLDSSESMKCIESIYLPEIKEYCPGAPYILVGTNSDKRDQSNADESISTEQGEEFQKKIGAKAYVECSVKNKTNIDKVFETALYALYESLNDSSSGKKRKGRKSCTIY